MESKAKLAGHPIHPMLVVLPLGLFIAAVVFDAIALWGGSPGLAVVGFWNIAGGVIGGLLAAMFGLVDWLAIPRGTRAKSIGLMHGGANVLVVLMFLYAWVTRFRAADVTITNGLFIVEIVALLIGCVGGWLGGELVDRLGVGVDDGANLDAPNSLSGRPARAR
jgi:uncharacterized membrane protein